MKTAQRELTLGQVVLTPGVLYEINPQDAIAALRRHQSSDWGECGKEDWAENDLALDEGLRIVSVYRDREKRRFWIITETDRSSTTILLPEEY